jgi:hypothetical protein
MECRSADIMDLLERVAKKAGRPLTSTQLTKIQDEMKKVCGEPFFGDKYLYKYLFLPARKMERNGGGILTLSDEYIEIIARYAEFEDYSKFLEKKDQKLPDELLSCVGVWYSYVRCNSGDMDVLASPVSIYQKANEIVVEMQGSSRSFKGEIRMERDCLYCSLKSGKGKNIHFVLKIGVALIPKVLQGVFSGVSSAGDPIAGREVLVRQELDFDKLKHKRLKISTLINSNNEEEKLIGEYFSDKQQNILKAGTASTYELNDLKKKA